MGSRITSDLYLLPFLIHIFCNKHICFHYLQVNSFLLIFYNKRYFGLILDL